MPDPTYRPNFLTLLEKGPEADRSRRDRWDEKVQMGGQEPLLLARTGGHSAVSTSYSNWR